MEGLIFLVVSVFGLVLFVGPIFSIVNFVRGRAQRDKLDELTRTVEELERRVRQLSAARPAAPVASTPPAPATPAGPAVPAAAPTPPVVRSTRPVPPAPLGPSTTPGTSTPPPLPAPAAARATVPPAPPPRPPVDPPATPPAAPSFDWESMLGVRGAAWLGGITIVIAALFFAKWSIDQGFFTPPIRVATMLVAGVAALTWAEVTLRGGYQPTANAVSGAAVVTLYAAFFAGHSLYQLFSLTVAFAGMSAVTAAAAAVALRHGAFFTAIVGLVGGLATPVLLSSGTDRPIALFTYLAVLAVGFLYVAERRSWAVLTVLAAAGTTFIELAWQLDRLGPNTLIIAVVAFAGLAAVYLWHAGRLDADNEPIAFHAALAAAVWPLAAAALICAQSRFAPQWPIVLADVALVCGGLVWVALRRAEPLLVAAAAGGAGVTVALTGVNFVDAAQSLWGLAIAAAALTGAFSALPRLAARREAEWLDESTLLAGVVRLAPAVGLLAFAWQLVDAPPPLWLFVTLVAVLFALVVDATTEQRRVGLLLVGGTFLALLCWRWVDEMAGPETFSGHAVIPHLFAVAVAIVAARRAALANGVDDRWRRAEDLAVVAAAAVAWASLVAGADRLSRFGDVTLSPAPVYALLAVEVAIVLLVAIRGGWTWLVPAAAAGVVLLGVSWRGRFGSAEAAVLGLAYVTVVTTFLLLPFVVARRLAPGWTSRPAPWLTAALIGPAMFPLCYDLWTVALGAAWIGALPLLLAAATVAALYGVNQWFAPAGDEAAAARRLNYLALFAAVALGFVATAIPLQLDRQWITIGWALEAAAVWWLFGRLPHPGLKYLGLLLFAGVGLRLLANPEVVRYQPRGRPIVNWLLYTYGVPALACFAGAVWLRRAERRRGETPAYDVLAGDRTQLAAAAGLLGLLLVFWLINLEIADFYSAGRYVEVDFSRHLQRDLTRSFAWGLYAVTLLVLGLLRRERGLRVVSLGFLMLTVGKVFVYDLAQLSGLYRILSFLALGVSLIVVSLLYQRFVKQEEAAA